MALNPFLSRLGVTPQQGARSPTSDAFPITFNVNNKRIWDAVLTDFVPSADPAKDWQKVIEEYVDRCAELGDFPFSNIKQSANDQIFDFLKEKRREVVYFLNKVKLRDLVALRNSKRRVNMTNNGFTLEVESQATPRDPTFEKWLLQHPFPRFENIRQYDNKYVKHLGKDLTFWVKNDGAGMSQRWHIGYTINCPLYPDIPDRPLASKAELERFVLEVFWEAIFRMNRPIGVMHRMI